MLIFLMLAERYGQVLSIKWRPPAVCRELVEANKGSSFVRWKYVEITNFMGAKSIAVATTWWVGVGCLGWEEGDSYA